MNRTMNTYEEEEDHVSFSSIDKSRSHYHLYTDSDYILLPRDAKTLTIHPAVKRLVNNAFFRHTHLQSISIPDSIVEIGTHVFDGCCQLKTVRMPKSLKSIQDCTFSGCSELESVIIPQNITHMDYVGEYAFYNCKKLSLLSLPTSIGKFCWSTAFIGCNTLKANIGGENSFSWLCGRYDHLPLHRVFYYSADKNMSVEMIKTTIIEENDTMLTKTDAMGMTPLHVICCNPNISNDIISTVHRFRPEAANMKTLDGKTPLMMLLNTRYGSCTECLFKDELLLPLFDLLKKGINWSILDSILLFNKTELESEEKHSGLLPFMLAASLKQCSLDILHQILISRPDLLLIHEHSMT